MTITILRQGKPPEVNTYIDDRTVDELVDGDVDEYRFTDNSSVFYDMGKQLKPWDSLPPENWFEFNTGPLVTVS